jgi:UDP-glucose 4-epimerase
MGSQLADWLTARVALRPMGFDPMMNLLSLPDAAEALRLAVPSDAEGVLNIPGADTLPLSRLAERNGVRCVDLPGPLLGPLYRLRARANRGDFRYDLNRNRFHFGVVLDGRRAGEVLGFHPRRPLTWPAV